ncbi:MAG: hypothetical protein V9G29_03505 [Burkholderiaceae bacterium]
MAGGVEFGDQPFGGVEIPGRLAADDFGDAAAEGVVLVAGAFLAVDVDPA